MFVSLSLHPDGQFSMMWFMAFAFSEHTPSYVFCKSKNKAKSCAFQGEQIALPAIAACDSLWLHLDRWMEAGNRSWFPKLLICRSEVTDFVKPLRTKLRWPETRMISVLNILIRSIMLYLCTYVAFNVQVA